MAKKTQGVEDLVHDVLQEFHQPYPENVIDQVFLQIEANSGFHTRYQDLCAELGQKWIVNNWIGKYTARLTGLQSAGQAKAASQLIGSYSKLV